MRKVYESTTVPESKSLLEIEFMLRRHGVDQVRWTSGASQIRIEFLWPYGGTELGFRIDLKIPALDSQVKKEQERRRQLRVLMNHIKAKLVAVDEGLVDLEQEFLAYMLTPGGETVGEMAKEVMATGDMGGLVLLPERTPR